MRTLPPLPTGRESPPLCGSPKPCPLTYSRLLAQEAAAVGRCKEEGSPPPRGRPPSDLGAHAWQQAQLPLWHCQRGLALPECPERDSCVFPSSLFRQCCSPKGGLPCRQHEDLREQVNRPKVSAWRCVQSSLQGRTPGMGARCPLAVKGNAAGSGGHSSSREVGGRGGFPGEAAAVPTALKPASLPPLVSERGLAGGLRFQLLGGHSL